MNSITLAVLCGLFLNLPLQMGIGIKDIYSSQGMGFWDSVLEALLLFLSLLAQWLLFALVFSPLTLGFFKYFALLPLGAALPLFLRLAANRLKIAQKEDVFAFPYRSGASVAAFLIMLSLAEDWSEALLIAAGLSCGVLFSMLLLRTIRFRINREKVQSGIRGVPLLLITMGILALAISSAAIIYLR